MEEQLTSSMFEFSAFPHRHTVSAPTPPRVVCVPIKLRANSKQTVDESIKESATHMFFFTSSGVESIN